MITVHEVMCREVITFPPDLPLHDVAAKLVRHGISGAPVVSADGTVIGVVSEADILIKEQGREAIPHRRLARVRGESDATRSAEIKAAATTAGDAMTSPPITIGKHATLAEAARIMTAQRINRLPVIHAGRLIGIVTRADLVRAFVRTDEELVTTIREDVLHRTLWLDPAAFRVAVTQGKASITGRVDRRSTADTIATVITMVPGIVELRSDITWELDDSKLRAPEVDLVAPFTLR